MKKESNIEQTIQSTDEVKGIHTTTNILNAKKRLEEIKQAEPDKNRERVFKTHALKDVDVCNQQKIGVEVPPSNP